MKSNSNTVGILSLVCFGSSFPLAYFSGKVLVTGSDTYGWNFTVVFAQTFLAIIALGILLGFVAKYVKEPNKAIYRTALGLNIGILFLIFLFLLNVL